MTLRFGGGMWLSPTGTPPPGPGLGKWQLLSCADTVRAPWTWVWWCQGLSGMVGECSCPQGAEGRETEAGGLQKWLQMSGTALFSTGGPPLLSPPRAGVGTPGNSRNSRNSRNSSSCPWRPLWRSQNQRATFPSLIPPLIQPPLPWVGLLGGARGSQEDEEDSTRVQCRLHPQRGPPAPPPRCPLPCLGWVCLSGGTGGAGRGAAAVTFAGGSPRKDPCGIRSRLSSPAPFFTP